jgi:hypothetical protein
MYTFMQNFMPYRQDKNQKATFMNALMYVRII